MRNSAANFGHRFKGVYQTNVAPGVRDGLLDLALETEAELAGMDERSLHMFDVQSFMWVVGAYGAPEPAIG